MSRVGALARSDLRSIGRDTLLLPLLVSLPLLVLAVRLLAVPATAWAAARGLDLRPHHPFIVAALLAVDVPLSLGSIVGLLLLDERDDGSLKALRVTPLGLAGYARYRLAGAAAFAFVVVLVGLPAVGLLPGAVVLAALPAVLPACLVPAVVGLALVNVAADKVEGLAVAKVIALVLAAPLLAWWFPDRWWSPLLALSPTYWPIQALWGAAAGGPAWPWALVGLIYNLALFGVLSRRFLHRPG